MRTDTRIGAKGHLYPTLESMRHVLLGGGQDFAPFRNEKWRQMKPLACLPAKTLLYRVSAPDTCCALSSLKCLDR